MFKINKRLATHGFGQNHEDYLQESMLRTGETLDGTDFTIIDCRDLREYQKNPLSLYEKKIREATVMLETHRKVVCCCKHGESRSNAIAAGVLIKYFVIDYDIAMELISKKVPIAQIKPLHQLALKELFNVK
jgi:protein-tyrosine phosphatase